MDGGPHMGRVLLGQSVGAFFTCNWLRMQAKQKQQQEFSSTLVVVGGPHGWRRWMVGPMGGVGGGWWAPWVESLLFKVALLLRQL